MKFKLAILLVSLLIPSGLIAENKVIVPGKYEVDSSHTQVMFTVKHLGLSNVTGKFVNFNGTIEIPSKNLAELKTSGSIASKSIDTANKKRDDHLRAPDFFNAEKHPEISFKSKVVKKVSENKFELIGELTILGNTRPISLETTYLGYIKDPWGKERIAFEAIGELNRKHFGLTWNKLLESGGLVVGENVKVKLEIEAVKSATS